MKRKDKEAYFHSLEICKMKMYFQTHKDWWETKAMTHFCCLFLTAKHIKFY